MHDTSVTHRFVQAVEDAVEAGRPRRVCLTLRGMVQGVGFRPFVFRLATELGVAGWVSNSSQGACVEVEGEPEQVEQFLHRLEHELPAPASIDHRDARWLEPAGYRGMEIRESDEAGEKTAIVLPDLATCQECLREIDDPANRRFRYPFTNCTRCGPRFSIIESLPYDRPRTTMRAFAMCPACHDEYDDPRDRRFHAQPTACPQCGPHLEWWDSAARPPRPASRSALMAVAPTGRLLAAREEALYAAARAIRAGAIVAVKGLGGFHLMVDARQDEAVRTLRARKHREEKPFALMVPSMELIMQQCEVSALEAWLLRSPEAPIVLVRRRAGATVASSVAPRNPWLGVMLPYTPLHHVLMQELNIPVVATSGNLSDEPICTDEREALTRLAGLADFFLVHDRPIARPVDDSVVRVMAGRELVLRRARGYAPRPIPLRRAIGSVVAVGAHLKNTVAVSVGSGAVVSQHLGDLDTVQAHQAFEEAISSLTRLHDVQPTTIACDLHPDYRSTRYARASGLPVVAVQHHEAHVRSCMAEHQVAPPVLGVAWDGTGYGTDGTVWGGEFFRVTDQGCERVAHLRRFRLPGGEQAVKEPRRSALGLLHELFGDAVWTHTELAPVHACSPRERQIVQTMLAHGVNAPWTSSAGRLFDAVASLIGLRHVTHFEGQAAMELEYAAEAAADLAVEAYPLPLVADQTPMVLDWGMLVQGIVRDLSDGVPAEVIAAKFHHAPAEGIVAVARQLGERRVVLSGGCFQNRVLTERVVERLREAGCEPIWHQRVPPNDGGIALGQLAGACA